MTRRVAWVQIAWTDTLFWRWFLMRMVMTTLPALLCFHWRAGLLGLGALALGAFPWPVRVTLDSRGITLTSLLMRARWAAETLERVALEVDTRLYAWPRTTRAPDPTPRSLRHARVRFGNAARGARASREVAPILLGSKKRSPRGGGRRGFTGRRAARVSRAGGAPRPRPRKRCTLPLAPTSRTSAARRRSSRVLWAT